MREKRARISGSGNTKDFSIFSCDALGNEIIFFRRKHKRATISFHPQIICIVFGYSSLTTCFVKYVSLSHVHAVSGKTPSSLG